MLNNILLGLLGFTGLLFFLIFLIIILASVCYLFTLQNTLKKISVENRKINPEKVWLLLIPIYNIYFNFIVVIRLSESLKSEFEKRKIDIGNSQPGYNIGIAHCCFLLLSLFSFINEVGIVANFFGTIFWVGYWISISRYSKLL